MKRIFFIISTFLLFQNSFPQSPNFTPFAFGISFGGNINQAKPQFLDAKFFEKKVSVGYHIGFLASFRKPKYFLETGLEYLSEGYAYKQINTDITKPTINSYLKEHKFFSLAIPLKFSLPLPDRVVTHVISFGIYPKVIINQQLYTQIEYKNGTNVKDILDQKREYSGFYPAINMAYGVEIPMGYNDVAIRIEPYFQLSFIQAKSENLSNTITAYGFRTTLFWVR